MSYCPHEVMRLCPAMRRTHVGREKIFVDSGHDTVDLIDPELSIPI